MNYHPLTAVWEVTMGCNMRCGHCGSSCEDKLPDELTTQEAFNLIDQIAELGLRWLTISGGEPLMRSDLFSLVERLSQRGVAVNIITNGWLLNAETAKKLKQSGVSTVAISIDGTEKIHDKIRKEGSYKRIMEAFGNLKQAGITVGVVTTVSHINFADLKNLYKELVATGFDSWQLQLGLPMGNFKERPEWVLAPEQIDGIIDFCYDAAMKREIIIYPADCIGYFTDKEIMIRQISGKSASIPLWDGCNAGIRSFGILHNGDILGCTSIRDKQYVEGNVKEKRLADIWNNPNGFSWRRSMTKDMLGMECATCTYGSKCLGGCPNTRLTMKGDIYAENQYCSYNVALKKMRSSLQERTDFEGLLASANSHLHISDFQAAAFTVERALALSPENRDALVLRGFAEFMCGNYSLSEEANRKALWLMPDDTYAMKGLGLALHKQGKSDEGLKHLEKAARLTNYADSDIMEDLRTVMLERANKR